MNNSAIFLTIKKGNIILGKIVSALFAGFCLLLAYWISLEVIARQYTSSKMNDFIAIPLILIFVGFAILCIWFVFRTAPKKVILCDKKGVYLAKIIGGGDVYSIPWEDIQSFEKSKFYTNQTIGIVLKDQEKYLQQYPAKAQDLELTGFLFSIITTSFVKSNNDIFAILENILKNGYLTPEENFKERPPEKKKRKA